MSFTLESASNPRTVSLAREPARLIGLCPGDSESIQLASQVHDVQTLTSNPSHFVDMVCEVPALLEKLSAPSRTALARSCRHLRLLIHSSAAVVSYKSVWAHWSEGNVERIFNGDWRQLALIKDERECCAFSHQFHPPADSKLQLIASLDAWRGRHNYSVFIVSPKTQQRQPDQQQIIDAALAHLCKPGWHAYGLSVVIYSQGNKIIAQMSHLNWPRLRYLNLSNNSLDSAAMKQLVAGRWPELKRLDLSKNLLDEAAIKFLSQGNWPALTELILDENPNVDAAAIACIPQAKCALLSGLSLTRIELDYVSMYGVALMHAQLESLCLQSTGIDTAAMSVLFATQSVSWVSLQRLVLSNNRLTADAIARLVTTSLPKLYSLDLASNDLDAGAACLLAQSRWSELRHLHLRFVAKGKWPELLSVFVGGNKFTASGYRALEAGQWPNLYNLCCSKFV